MKRKNIFFNFIIRIKAEKESEIKNKIIQITIEKKKLRLLTQNTPITSQVPKNTAVKLPQKPLAVATTASPILQQQKSQQQQSKDIQIPNRNIPNPLPKQANALENEQKIEQVLKCSEENPNGQMEVVELHQIDEKVVLDEVNSAIDKQPVIDSSPAESTSIQKVIECPIWCGNCI